MLLTSLVGHGFTLATGVPCSLLAGSFRLLEAGDDDLRAVRYVAAPREDSAIAIASGAAVAGTRCAVFMQNSGLGNSLNVITSFNLIYDVPVLLIVSWRGCDPSDAVEHDVIGRELINLLDLFELPHVTLDPETPDRCVRQAIEQMESTRRCAALVVKDAI
jgi:phosphonopyruvate decarboxylase